MKIIFDYNRTLFNPDTDSLYQGVIELLQDLSQDNELFLVSKNEPGRETKLQGLEIGSYFKNVSFVDKKTVELFENLTGNDKNVLVVGDRIKGEITLGNKLGLITVWVKQGKFAAELPTSLDEQPTHTIKNITELLDIISKYEK